mmetsp:Transcript_13872/g.32412  ORF Transcript_13872/g.32412 Transcript_13872/m.32412 type:complete len:247 (+) Transcript_13872:407-1147(+)
MLHARCQSAALRLAGAICLARQVLVWLLCALFPGPGSHQERPPGCCHERLHARTAGEHGALRSQLAARQCAIVAVQLADSLRLGLLQLLLARPQECLECAPRRQPHASPPPRPPRPLLQHSLPAELPRKFGHVGPRVGAKRGPVGVSKLRLILPKGRTVRLLPVGRLGLGWLAPAPLKALAHRPLSQHPCKALASRRGCSRPLAARPLEALAPQPLPQHPLATRSAWTPSFGPLPRAQGFLQSFPR